MFDNDNNDNSKIGEKITKQNAFKLFNSHKFNSLLKTAGTFKNLQQIHYFLFKNIYDWVGKIRQVNISKNNFMFANCNFLDNILQTIEIMPQNDFNQIVEKYIAMNIAHPFREGNGRAMRIWLDLIFKKQLNKIVNWQLISLENYLSAMLNSLIKNTEIKHYLRNVLITDTNDKKMYMQNFDVSCLYEGLTNFKTENIM